MGALDAMGREGAWGRLNEGRGSPLAPARAPCRFNAAAPGSLPLA